MITDNHYQMNQWIMA